MFSSRCLTMFLMLALCLAPLNTWDRSPASQIITPTPAPAISTAHDSATAWTPSAPDTPCHAAPGNTTRISLAWNGIQGNRSSYQPTISADGKYVAYASSAENLVEGDANQSFDVFLFNRTSGQVELISQATDGKPGDGHSSTSSLSADVRFIAFDSLASNLVSGDTNNMGDVFIRDRLTNVTARVSVSTNGTQGENSSFEPSISADGRLVAFTSAANNLVEGDTNEVMDVFVHDRQSGETQRVSVASDGTQGRYNSFYPSISADGRFVAFTSSADNLVDGDTNGVVDIFVHDRQSGETRRVSQASDGSQANGSSERLAFSADGHLVAFASYASNLVKDDTNGWTDIFVHNLQSGETRRVSLASDGTQTNDESNFPSISADGRFVAFRSDANNLVKGDRNGVSDIFLHDTLSGETTLVSVASDGTQANLLSLFSSVSADGRFVAFESEASNLVRFDTNGVSDIFVHDRGRQGGVAEARIDAQPVSGLAPLTVTFTNQTICGRDVACNVSTFLWDFGDGITSTHTSPTHTYTATDVYTVKLTVNSPGGEDTLVCSDYIYVYDRLSNLTRASLASDGTQGNDFSSNPAISASGRFVAFESNASNLVNGDSNQTYDIFVHDRQSGETQRVSLASDGAQGYDASYSPSISYDGRYVAFASDASNLVATDTNVATDIFVHDRLSRATRRVSVATDGAQANANCLDPAISTDGRFVAFASYASNLVDGDTNHAVDVFVHDLLKKETQRVSLASDGTPGDGDSSSPAISADGRYVAFTSWANNLVSDDTNHQMDVFVHDRQTGQTARLSLASDGTQGENYSSSPAISADGRFVAFLSWADNLVSDDTNQASDIFVHDRQAGQTQRISLSSDGTSANGSSGHPAISADGRSVTFASAASNLVKGDTNLATDVFLHDRQNSETHRLSIASDGIQGNYGAASPSITADGNLIAFDSYSDNLVSEDINNANDIFVNQSSPQAPPVQADFSASPLSGVDTLTVTFTNQTTCGGKDVVLGRDVACNVSTNLWFFGDGETSLQSSPTHTYTTPGVYDVTLFASGSGGTDSLTRHAYIVVRGARSHYIPLVTR